MPYKKNKEGESLAEKNPDLITEWNAEKNVGLTPWNITSRNKKKVWWKCKYGHEWEASIYSRTGLGTGCPYCSGQRTITGKNDLATTHPELLFEWDYDKNVITPQEVMHGSEKKVWWKCHKGHEWQAVLASRVRGNGCPYCSNKKVLPGYNDLATKNPKLKVL